MLYWAAVFFIIALVAGMLGFTDIAVGASEIARILFFIFLIFLLISLVFGWRRRIPPAL